MTNLERLISGLPLVHQDKAVYTEKELYLSMHKEGKRRFGSECKHEESKKGYCKKCLRKVI